MGLLNSKSSNNGQQELITTAGKSSQAESLTQSTPTGDITYREVKGTDWDTSTLVELRIACGWNIEAVPQWIEDVRNGHRLMWFIYHETPLKNDGAAALIGMIGLNLFDPEDLTIANFKAPGSDKGVRAELTSLFIYSSYRERGMGGKAIEFVEGFAAGLGVKTMTINTAAAGPNLSRYLKTGYREYKSRERRYPLEVVLGMGLTEAHCYAAFLEKALG